MTNSAPLRIACRSTPTPTPTPSIVSSSVANSKWAGRFLADRCAENHRCAAGQHTPGHIGKAETRFPRVCQRVTASNAKVEKVEGSCSESRPES